MCRTERGKKEGERRTEQAKLPGRQRGWQPATCKLLGPLSLLQSWKKFRIEGKWKLRDFSVAGGLSLRQAEDGYTV